MTLYKISPASNDFYTLNTVKETEQGQTSLIRGNSIKDTWETPQIGVVADGKPGDFLSYAGKIACTEKAYRLLKSFLGDSAEFLPAIHKKSGTQYYLLNVLVKVSLDLENTKAERSSSGRILMVIKHAFKESDVTAKKIFNVAESLAAGPIVSEEFKAFIEDNKLEGLRFKQVC